MANTKSAQKAQRQTERRTLRNRSTRSAVKTYVTKATAAVADGTQVAAAAVRLAVRALDKAARKGIIHPNSAARRKSRLMSRLHALSVAVPTPTSSAAETAPTRSRRRTAASAADKAPAATPRKRTTAAPRSASGG